MLGVSVIVPVYNAEKYLKRGVDSILGQTYTDFELILVDDGSQDESGRMCDDYAMSNPQIHVIHQANKGVSAARQVGLDAAIGEYVIFADPDDWIDPTMLDDLYQKAKQDSADVVICDFWVNSSTTAKRYENQRPNSLKPDTILSQLLLGELHGSTCNKLYNKATLKRYNISFPSKIIYCEDLWFNCKLLMNSNVRIGYLNKAYYHYDYYSNPNGLSRKVKTKSVHDYQQFCDYIFESLDEYLFANEFHQLRCKTIELAFLSDCSSKEFYSICDNDDSMIIKKSVLKSKMHFVRKYGILFALNGHLHFGRLLSFLYDTIYLPISMFVQRQIHLYAL